MFFVRTAMEKDVEALRGLLIESFHATYDTIYGADRVHQMLDAWHSRKAIETRISRKDGEFLVADNGRQIGGLIFAAMSKDMAKTAFLHHLYVDPKMQRQGIGRDLFAEIETCFPDAEIMRLEVEPQNAAAIAFYQAHGFVEVDRTKNCGGPNSGIEAIVMEKPLT